MLLVFKQENHGSGTRALTQYLQAMTIPRKCINEIIPEEVEYLIESEMQKTILRVQTLSNSALESNKDKDCLKKKPTSTSTCGELLGQPRLSLTWETLTKINQS